MKNRIKLKILKIIFASKLQQNYIEIVAALAPHILETHIWNIGNFLLYEVSQMYWENWNFQKRDSFFLWNFLWGLKPFILWGANNDVNSDQSSESHENFEGKLISLIVLLILILIFKSLCNYNFTSIAYSTRYHLLKLLRYLYCFFIYDCPSVLLFYIWLSILWLSNSPTINFQCNPLPLKFHGSYAPS